MIELAKTIYESIVDFEGLLTQYLKDPQIDLGERVTGIADVFSDRSGSTSLLDEERIAHTRLFDGFIIDGSRLFERGLGRDARDTVGAIVQVRYRKLHILTDDEAAEAYERLPEECLENGEPSSFEPPANVAYLFSNLAEAQDRLRRERAWYGRAGVSHARDALEHVDGLETARLWKLSKTDA